MRPAGARPARALDRIAVAAGEGGGIVAVGAGIVAQEEDSGIGRPGGRTAAAEGRAEVLILR